MTETQRNKRRIDEQQQGVKTKNLVDNEITPQPICGARREPNTKHPKVVPSITKNISYPHKPRIGSSYQAELPALPSGPLNKGKEKREKEEE